MNENDFSSFNHEEFCGWQGAKQADILQETLSRYGSQSGEYKQLEIVGDTKEKPKRVALYELVRKVLGKDTPNYAQLRGDCTSFASKNVVEYLECVQIALGNRQTFEPIHPSYIYGCERVFVGGRRLWGDGGLGAWCADAVKRYGVISTTSPGVPAYSKELAGQWGSYGPPKELIELGKQHLIKSTAPIRIWNDATNALSNGYPIIVCSNYGFTYKLDSQGFNRRSGQWDHAMACMAYCEDMSGIPDHVLILNSWADVFEHIVDFVVKGQEWPIGTLRIHREDFEGMIAQGDSYTFSNFEGFPAQNLPESFFDQF